MMSDVLGHPEKKHQDWSNEHEKHLKKLLKPRNTARQESLPCNTRSKEKKHSKAQSELQKYTGEMESNWWGKKAEELQTTRNMKTRNILQRPGRNLQPQTERIDPAKGSGR